MKTGIIYASVINLPGPASQRRFHTFAPSGSNDMVSVAFYLFDQVLTVDLYARWVGP